MMLEISYLVVGTHQEVMYQLDAGCQWYTVQTVVILWIVSEPLSGPSDYKKIVRSRRYRKVTRLSHFSTW